MQKVQSVFLTQKIAAEGVSLRQIREVGWPEISEIIANNSRLISMSGDEKFEGSLWVDCDDWRPSVFEQ